MTNKITGTFVCRRFQDSGRDQSPDYFVYEFTNIVDNNGEIFSDKWIKETKLLQAVPFQKGRQYQITLSEKPYSANSVKLPFPTEISWGQNKVYIKGGNSIISINQHNTEKKLSEPINKVLSLNNYETAARNKFGNGELTEELLLKMNTRGIFYFVHSYASQDKRKNGGFTYGTTTEEKVNYILIQKQTQIEIDRELESIKRNFVTPELEKHFKITTELLESKKRK